MNPYVSMSAYKYSELQEETHQRLCSEGSIRAKMVESASAANLPFHARTISFPPRSHPVELRIEEELHSLRSSMVSSLATPDAICDRLRGIGGLYSLVEELIHLASSQHRLIHPVQRKLVEEELEESIRVLDLCSAVRDGLAAMKQQIHGVRLALRRREVVAIVSKVGDFVRLGKKANRDISSGLISLKQKDDKRTDKNDTPTAIRVLMELKMISVSVIQLVVSFFSTQTRRPKSSRWSLVSKTLSRRKVHGASGEDGRLDIFSWYSSTESISCKDVDDEKILKAQSQLCELEVSIEKLDNGLECLFRQMILSRVSLLNILSS